MSGYIGASSRIPNTIANIEVYEHEGLAQQNIIKGDITIQSYQNRTYFGDTTFTGDITVSGQMIIAGGSPNFSGGDINITGTLYAY